VKREAVNEPAATWVRSLGGRDMHSRRIRGPWIADGNRQTKTLMHVVKLHPWIGQVVASPQKSLQSDGATAQHCTPPVCDLDLIIDHFDDIAGADRRVWVRWRTESALSDTIEWAGKDCNITRTNVQGLRCRGRLPASTRGGSGGYLRLGSRVEHLVVRW